MTITDDKIASLRDAAAAHGDHAQVLIASFISAHDKARIADKFTDADAARDECERQC